MFIELQLQDTSAAVGNLPAYAVTGASRFSLGKFSIRSAALIISPGVATQGETLNVTLTGWTFLANAPAPVFGGPNSGVSANSVQPSPDKTQEIVNVTIALGARVTPALPVTVTLTLPQGTYTLTGDKFAIKPGALTLSPNSGTQGENMDVTITGWTFTSGTTVEFKGPGSGITVNSVTLPNAGEAIVNITIAPTAATKHFDVIVSDGFGTFTEASAFTVLAP